MIFVQANFTGADGTLLSDYTGEVGGLWVQHGSHPVDTIILTSNRANKDPTTGTAVYYATDSAPELDYSLRADIVDIGNVNRAMGIFGWIDPTADNMIGFRRQTATAWQFLTIIGGSPNSLETVATSFVQDAVNNLKVVRIGNLFYCYINEVLTPLSPHEITAAEFQIPGKVGLRASNSHENTGYHVDNFVAETIEAAAAAHSRLKPLMMSND